VRGVADSVKFNLYRSMDPLPLSLLNDFLYCPRRAALKAVEGWREENVHTVLGQLAHEHADLPGYEVAKGVLVWRSLPIWSERLGLSGKCDIVEAILDPVSEKPEALTPVEYKKGKRRRFDNDDAQVCAQALCLEEMFGMRIQRGAIFHAASKRRREIELTAQLREFTENAIAELRCLLQSGQVPPAIFKPACEECSLFDVCLPKVTKDDTTSQRANASLFCV
jgi:CRISPR-associated exonuclease Cas4